MSRYRSTAFVMMAMVMGCLFASIQFSARTEVQAKENERERERPQCRIAFVNVAEVLKGYKKANMDGDKITESRKTYFDAITEHRNRMNEINQELQKDIDARTKDELIAKMTKLQRKIEDIDRNAQKELGDMSNQAVVDVYKSINSVIADLAKERDLDCVQIFPGPASDTPITAPIAHLVLQTPASYPIYLRKELNLTEEVIERLNSSKATTKITPKGE